MIVQYGDWKINADVLKTKMYYSAFAVSNDQFSRNFREYCKTLTNEEREFFDSFGIDPMCANVSGLGIAGKKTAPTDGYFYIFGSYESVPSQPTASVDDLIKNGLSMFSKDNSVKIGAFRFEFQRNDDPNSDIPNGMPESCLCVRFYCDEMAWLLPEKLHTTLTENSSLGNVFARLTSKLRRGKKTEDASSYHSGELLCATSF